MNHKDHPYLDRRTVLKGSGIALAGVGGLATPAAAKGGKRISLMDGPAEFQLFWSSEKSEEGDPNELTEFGYPKSQGEMGSPFMTGEDPVGGLFDASEIEMTSNGKTLHHTLRFFNGWLIKRNHGNPYILQNMGQDPNSGLFVFNARNQHMTFRAVSKEELSNTPIGEGAYVPPFSVLVGKKWRALGREILFIAPDTDGNPSPVAPYSATRLDFYELGKGRPEFNLSLLYIIYPNDGKLTPPPVPADPDNPDIVPIPPVPYGAGANFITEGRLQMGRK